MSMDGLPREKQKHENDHSDSSSSMNDLPLDLLQIILFRLEPKSLAMMRCTNRSIKSHISEDPDFESKYLSRFGSNLFNSYKSRSNYIYRHPLVSSCDSMSHEKSTYISSSERCYIFGSCSGLILLYMDGLFIANPLTKRFRILDHSGSKLIPLIVGNFERPHFHKIMCIGFAVDRNRTTKKFKIVCILEMQTRYEFEISDGDSWRLSKTTVTAGSISDLVKRMKPVYLNGTLHWLRKDGSIIAFNPETEQARFIPSSFHREPDLKLLFEADDKTNRLTLISGTKETISVYTLLGNPKWTLDKRIKNVSMEESMFECWNVVAYDGKRLVVRGIKNQYIFKGVVHVYDMETNSWGVLGSTTEVDPSVSDFYKFTPSLVHVEEGEIVASNDRHILDLTAIMELINTAK